MMGNTQLNTHADGAKGIFTLNKQVEVGKKWSKRHALVLRLMKEKYAVRKMCKTQFYLLLFGCFNISI